jgi:hypothetical protein
MIGLAKTMMQAVAEEAGLPNDMLFAEEPPARQCNCWRCRIYFGFVESCPLRMSSAVRFRPKISQTGRHADNQSVSMQ